MLSISAASSCRWVENRVRQPTRARPASTSTGSYEASYIASELLTALAVMRARGIFSTHLHELASALPEINERSVAGGGVRIDTLVAGIEEGKRSFKIHRAKPDGKSYAKDIADKYGLSFESLVPSVREEAQG